MQGALQQGGLLQTFRDGEILADHLCGSGDVDKTPPGAIVRALGGARFPGGVDEQRLDQRGGHQGAGVGLLIILLQEGDGSRHIGSGGGSAVEGEIVGVGAAENGIGVGAAGHEIGFDAAVIRGSPAAEDRHFGGDIGR